jgi:hypothetical protein
MVQTQVQSVAVTVAGIVPTIQNTNEELTKINKRLDAARVYPK